MRLAISNLVDMKGQLIDYFLDISKGAPKYYKSIKKGLFFTRIGQWLGLVFSQLQISVYGMKFEGLAWGW